MTKLDLVALFVMIMITMIGMMMVMMLTIMMMITLMVRCFILQLSHQKTNQAFLCMFVMGGQQTVSLYIYIYHII